MKILRLFKCLFGYHTYKPVYEQRWIERKKKRTHIKSQFSCDCCGKKTKWLNRKNTEEFLETKAKWG